MKIITTKHDFFFNISKREFLKLKMKFQNSSIASGFEFMKKNTKLTEKEIKKLFPFLLKHDFRIEE